eukprot:10199403-Alexandrium_andersonii.AAC.1
MSECQRKKKDFFTSGMFKYLPLPKEAPNLDRDALWRNLQDHNLIAQVALIGKGAHGAVRPVVSCKKKLQEVADVAAPQSPRPELPELYDVAALGQYLNSNPNRQRNVEALKTFYATFVRQLSQTGGKRGKKPQAEIAALSRVQSMADKYAAGEDMAQA